MEKLPTPLMDKVLASFDGNYQKKVPWTWAFHPYNESCIKLVEESTTIPKLYGYIGLGGSIAPIGIFRLYVASDSNSPEYKVAVITNRSDSALLYVGVKRDMFEIKIDPNDVSNIFDTVIANPIIQNWCEHQEAFKDFDLWRVVDNDSHDLRYLKESLPNNGRDLNFDDGYCHDNIEKFDLSKLKSVCFVCDHDNDEDDIFGCDWDFTVYYVDDTVIFIRTHVD